MTEDDKGNIWMATYAGVVQYDGDHFIVWNKEQGLSSNTVYLILFDKTHKNIWAGTNNGLNKLNVKKLRKKGKAHFKHYGKEEGFLGLECNPDAVEKDNRNNIWFGTVNGLVKFNPRKDHKNLVETKTNITNIRVELQDTSLPQKATLPYYKNQITFNFSGICLTNPEKVKYKYKLEGFDNNWSPVTKEQVAHYTNLSPGTYTFKVKSCNNEGIWNRSPTTFKFTIAPPFWRTKEFYAVCLILLFSGLYGGHKIRVRKIEQEREKLETKVAERTQELEQKNEQLEKLSLVASRTDNGIIIADAEGNIEWINEGYTRLTGYTLKEIRSEKGSNVMEISAHPEIQNIIEEAIEDKVSQRYEAINYTKGGDKIWVASTLTPITDKNNEVRKLIIIDTDITEQKEAERIIRQKNKDITDSIRYAKRIQEAILPKKEKIKQAFPESFIFYQPRDMVSGDFYWFHRYDNVCILAAVDCTGHGVPGALMSMIGNDLLNQIVIQNQVTDPATILSQMNKGVTNILNTKNEQGTQDGMDMGICKINMDAGDLVYSGALRPLYIVRAANNKFEEIKGNTWSVGGHINTDKHFENVTLTLQEGDMFYLFSDGYPDQFGGEKGKKFMIKNFKSFLHQIASYKAKRQEENLKKTFQSWKKDEEQVDDILVMGVKYV